MNDQFEAGTLQQRNNRRQQRQHSKQKGDLARRENRSRRTSSRNRALKRLLADKEDAARKREPRHSHPDSLRVCHPRHDDSGHDTSHRVTTESRRHDQRPESKHRGGGQAEDQGRVPGEVSMVTAVRTNRVVESEMPAQGAKHYRQQLPKPADDQSAHAHRRKR
jgi:hypothetical protein